MNLLKNTIVLALMQVGHYAIAQGSVDLQTEISKGNFLVGEWTGQGYVMDREKGKVDFLVEESVHFGLDSTVIVLNGRGVHAQTGDRVHEALGLIYYDTNEDKLRIETHALGGRHVVTDILLEGDKSMRWGFEVPTGRVEYRASFTEDQWTEEGFFVTPEGQSYPFLKMDLQRQ